MVSPVTESSNILDIAQISQMEGAYFSVLFVLKFPLFDVFPLFT
jgi:hypothetical protein